MGRQFIVVQASPDWHSFDVELSRNFCRRVSLPETTVVDFVDLWDRTLQVGYRDFRFRTKEIAGSTLAAVANARVVSLTTSVPCALRRTTASLLSTTTTGARWTCSISRLTIMERDGDQSASVGCSRRMPNDVSRTQGGGVTYFEVVEDDVCGEGP